MLNMLITVILTLTEISSGNASPPLEYASYRACSEMAARINDKGNGEWKLYSATCVLKVEDLKAGS